MVAQLGSIGFPDSEADNCDESGAYPYGTPDEPGIDTITCYCTFSDGGKATAVSIATVIEEEEED